MARKTKDKGRKKKRIEMLRDRNRQRGECKQRKMSGLPRERDQLERQGRPRQVRQVSDVGAQMWADEWGAWMEIGTK